MLETLECPHMRQLSSCSTYWTDGSSRRSLFSVTTANNTSPWMTCSYQFHIADHRCSCQISSQGFTQISPCQYFQVNQVIPSQQTTTVCFIKCSLLNVILEYNFCGNVQQLQGLIILKSSQISYFASCSEWRDFEFFQQCKLSFKIMCLC